MSKRAVGLIRRRLERLQNKTDNGFALCDFIYRQQRIPYETGKEGLKAGIRQGVFELVEKDDENPDNHEKWQVRLVRE